MDKQRLDISEELNKLKAYMGRDMASMSAEEINMAKKEIQKLSQNIEEVLTRQAGLPRNSIVNLINDMNEKFALNVGKNIRATREQEYDATRKTVDTVQKDDSRGAMAKVSQIEQTGVVTNDRKYEQTLEQICDEVFIEYKMRLSKANNRRVDEAVYDIRSMIKRASGRMMDIHASFSRDIKKVVAEKISELDESVRADLLEQVEEEVVRIGKEQGIIPEEPETAVIIDSDGVRHEITDVEEIDKILKEEERAAMGFNDFAKKMQGLTVSDEELAKQDAKEIEYRSSFEKKEKQKNIDEEQIV